MIETPHPRVEHATARIVRPTKIITPALRSRLCIIFLVVVVLIGAVLAGVVDDPENPPSASPPAASAALQVGKYGEHVFSSVLFSLSAHFSLLSISFEVRGPWNVAMSAFSAFSATAIVVLYNALARFALDAVMARFRIRLAIFLLTVMLYTDLVYMMTIQFPLIGLFWAIPAVIAPLNLFVLLTTDTDPYAISKH
jgi:hypothetical protein